MSIVYKLDFTQEVWNEDSSDYQQKKEEAAAYWAKDAFFGPETVVLGLDVGIEGIGICIRKGKEILYCKSLIVDLPEAEALATRRAFRASRHVRKNRRRRMRLLKDLFGKHGLPWVNDDIMSRSDPYLLRHRGSIKTLASREALSICIRSLVQHRGYDYQAMKDQGSYPWGETTKISELKSWLDTAYIDSETADYILSLEEELTANGKPLKDADLEQLRDMVHARRKESEKKDINAVCAEYAKTPVKDRRARGMNFPRKLVEKNLRELIDRHRHLIDDPDGFTEALFLPCKTKEQKERAIFFYNRKTPDEAKAHFEKKVKDCPLSVWLKIPLGPERKCCLRGDVWFRRWKLIDFLSVRGFYVSSNQKFPKGTKIPSEIRRLPASVIQALVEFCVPDNGEVKPWKEAEKLLKDSLNEAGLVFVDKKVKEHANWNTDQTKALKDLCSPEAAGRKERANMCRLSAERLCNIATADGTDFDPEAMERRKKESGLYDRRQEISLYGGIYPQVSVLLGTLGKKLTENGEELEQKTDGVLQRIFRELKPQLDGKTKPDYVVVECVRNGAKNLKQRQELNKKNEDNRKSKERWAETYGLKGGNISRSQFFRIKLWEEQGGTLSEPAKCPFTGKPLPCSSPLDDGLDLAHLFPDSLGGFYETDNLVLTTKQVNHDMGNMTPV